MTTKPNHLTFIEQITQHALTNYEEDGWDYWVECYDTEDRLEVIEGAKTYEHALRKAHRHLKRLDDHRKEIQSTAF